MRAGPVIARNYARFWVQKGDGTQWKTLTIENGIEYSIDQSMPLQGGMNHAGSA
ncbi:hypothetical protein [Bifidobacterium hapali]|uniref:hypothetical protein n=1 Tax=Bifidobacterium hapali TaxID=1630172 RepID=UPI0013032E93|nr:hypothetical protein [Bifidobacterium hapali]